MQLFIQLKKCFKDLGINSDEKSAFGVKNVITLILFVYCFGGMVTFLLLEPNKTFFDLGNAFFGVVCLVLNTSTLMSNIITRKKIFNLFKNFEDFIEISK